MSMTYRRTTRPFKVKEITDTGEFSGYGSVFGVKDSYGDIVIKGAFAKSLKEWEEDGKLPKMLWQHDIKEPIGVYSEMREDDHGLFVRGQILVDAGPLEKRAYTHLKAGSIDKMSIGYTLGHGGVEYSEEDDAYLLKQINLWEVSLVTFAANDEANVNEVKALLAKGPKEFERFLREAGLSRSQAKGLMSRGYDGLRDLREAEDVAHDELEKSLEKMLKVLAK